MDPVGNGLKHSLAAKAYHYSADECEYQRHKNRTRNPLGHPIHRVRHNGIKEGKRQTHHYSGTTGTTESKAVVTVGTTTHHKLERSMAG